MVQERKFYDLVDASGESIGGMKALVYAEFVGAQARTAFQNSVWHDFHFEPARPDRVSATGVALDDVYRLYLPEQCLPESWSKYGLVFSGEPLRKAEKEFGIIPSCMKIQFMRDDNVCAVCLRASELEKARKTKSDVPFFGFGRPHPLFPKFKAQPKFAGPLTLWGEHTDFFESIFFKTHAHDCTEQYFSVGVSWLPRISSDVFVTTAVVEEELVFPELVGKKLGGAMCVDFDDPEHGKRNSEALEELFVRTRRPVNDGRPGSNKMDKTHR